VIETTMAAPPAAVPDRRYTRWTRAGAELVADILGGRFQVGADETTGLVRFAGADLTPDEARLYGVRLVEAAALADGGRAVRDVAL
jgi:hypothetical protein